MIGYDRAGHFPHFIAKYIQIKQLRSATTIRIISCSLYLAVFRRVLVPGLRSRGVHRRAQTRDGH